MSQELDVAKHYFDVSNESNFDEIGKLFTPTTTYSSQTTGVYLGVDSILEMQRKFHGSFKKLHWQVNSVEEVKPGVVLFDYDFIAERPDGESVHSQGLEYVIVVDGKVQHVEIRNKA